MKVYKEKQFLIFEFHDGKTVKYDFAKKQAIGKSGKPVKDLKSQLSEFSIDEICKCCVDEQYGKYLKFLKSMGGENGTYISNIGTILNNARKYSKYEQFFSAGIEKIETPFDYKISDIPKGLIKLCREYNLKLTNDLVIFYKENPNEYTLAFESDYISLNLNDIYKILTRYESRYIRDGHYYKHLCSFDRLINEYGYTAKALLNYLDYCKTFEAIVDMDYLIRELIDYASMMSEISDKFDKYPRHFLTTHKIASRNYNRLKTEFDDNKFKQKIDKSMEKTFGEYCFIYPNNTQDIKDESTMMNNCVSSYIQKVIDGHCHILFLRYKDSPNESLVTIEVRDNRIVQALQKYNQPLTKEQQIIVEKWNEWRANKIKEEKEREELKYVS